MALLAVAIVGLSLGLEVLSVAPVSAESRFVVEAIDSLPSTALFYPSLALDRAGQPRVTYIKVSNEALLRFASRTGNTWVIETVAPASESHTTVALDSEDRPRILYRTPNGAVEYVTRSSGVWSFETIATLGSNGSLALDSNGDPHVVYRGLGGQMQYARKLAGTWTIEAVGATAQNCKVGLDSRGGVHVAFFNGDDVRYARRSNGSWTNEGAGGVQYLWEDLSLAVDSRGLPHITYANAIFEAPIYAVYLRRTEGGQWISDSFQSPNERGYGAAGMGSSIAIDSQGKPAITYGYSPVFGPAQFKYAKRLTNEWRRETVELDEGWPWTTSIALDRADNVHVVYRNANPGVLNYARRLPIAFPENGASAMQKQIADNAGQRLEVWAMPNPSRRSLQIHYKVPTTREVLIDVVDVQGRRVYQAAANPSMTDHVTWSAIDAQGQAVASGIYYISLRASGKTATTRVVLLR